MNYKLIFFKGRFIKSALLFVFLLMTSCTTLESKASFPYPVQWHKGFILNELLEENAPADTRDQLKELLSMNWYATINVTNPNAPDQVVAINNCNQFFNAEKNKLELQNPNEANAYIELATMCHADSEIIKAQNASVSYLRQIKLDANSPSVFPPEIAFITSSTERKKLLNQFEKKSWAQIAQIKSCKVIDEYSAVYEVDGGRQEIEILAHGDFNGDRIDDILLISKNSITNGSYFTIYLFILTQKSPDTHFELIKEYNVFN